MYISVHTYDEGQESGYSCWNVYVKKIIIGESPRRDLTSHWHVLTYVMLSHKILAQIKVAKRGTVECTRRYHRCMSMHWSGPVHGFVKLCTARCAIVIPFTPALLLDTRIIYWTARGCVFVLLVFERNISVLQRTQWDTDSFHFN